MTVDEKFGVRLDDLGSRMRALQEGIRTLQARLAAWDRDREARVERVREESFAMPIALVAGAGR